MKTKLIFMLFFAWAFTANAQIIYVNGAHIVCNPGSHWVLNEGDFTLFAPQADLPASFSHFRIGPNASLTVAPTSFLTINGTLTNLSGMDGLVLQSGSDGTASLMHNTPNIEATVERYLTGNPLLQSKHYHQVCFPLNAPVTAADFLGAYMWEWSHAQQEFVSIGSSTETSVSNNSGYFVFYPESSVTYDFAGQLNNGLITLPLATQINDFSLVPNPYPSAIDWDATVGWTRTNLEGSYWIWSPTANNYAVYNGFVGSLGATEFIPSGQAFFVKNAAGSAVLELNNNARTHSFQDYFKITHNEMDYLSIRVDVNGFKDEILVLFHEQSENIKDSFDSNKLFGSSGSPQLFSVSADGAELSINCIPKPEKATMIPVSYSLDSNVEVRFEFSMHGSFDQKVRTILEDVLRNEMIDLSLNNSYTFQHNKDNHSNRFVLHFEPVTDIAETKENAFKYWSEGGDVFLSLPDMIGVQANIQMFDVAGNLLLDKDYVLSNPTVIHAKKRGVVIIKVADKESIRVAKLFIQ
jgi:hypothetical protein